MLLHVVAIRRPELWAPSRAAKERARERLQDLVALLADLQKESQTEAVPYRARAIALIGYTVFGRPTSTQHPPVSRPTDPGARDVPEALRGELPDLRGGLAASTDAVGRFLYDELTEIAQAIAKLSAANLLLSSIRDPAFLRRCQSIEASLLLRRAHPAFENTADIMALTHRGVPGQEHWQTIDDATKVLTTALDGDLSQEKRIDLFHIRTEVLFLKALSNELEPSHRRAKAHAALAQRYRDVIADYPDSALAHLRLHYVLDEAGHSEEALRHIEQALELVDGDPWLPHSPDGPHWVQGLVRRRRAIKIVGDSAKQHWTAALSERPSGSVQRDVKVLVDACKLCLDAERRDTSPQQNEAHRIETVRRANNLIYWAARLLEREGGYRAMKDLDPNNLIPGLVGRLLPHDIESCDEPDYLHTVGAYFAATGQRAEAARAAARLFDAVFREGKELTSTLADVHLREVLEWRIGGLHANPAFRPGPGLSEGEDRYEPAPAQAST